MKVLLCIVLLQFQTGYGTYLQDKQVKCVDQGKVFPTGDLHDVDCSLGLSVFRLSDNPSYNRPLRKFMIAEKDYHYGKECFRWKN